MNRASPAVLRQTLETAHAYAKAGIDKTKLRYLAMAQPVKVWSREEGEPSMMTQERMFYVIGPGGVSCWEHGARDRVSSAYIVAADPATILALLDEIERLEIGRNKTIRDIEQELEVWRHGPSCWNCGDSGDVHNPVGEWLGQCDCLAAQLIDVTSERDKLKSENEALRRDAKRYRFLRNQHWPVAYLAVVVNPKVSVKLGHDCPSGDRLDEQVDGAMMREARHD